MNYFVYLCFVNQLKENIMFTERFRNVLAFILFVLQICSMITFFFYSKNQDQLIFSFFCFLGFGALGTFCLILNAKAMEEHK